MQRSTHILIDPDLYPSIVIDVDDVICNTCEILQQCLTLETGTNIAVDDWTDHRLQISYPMLTDSDINAIIENHQIFSKVQPIDGVQQALQSLRNHGYLLHLCTARASIYNHSEVTEVWLSDNNIQYDSISYVPFSKNKSDFYSEIDSQFSYLFDDAIHNIDDALRSGKVIKPVIVTKPWNRNHNGVLRVDGLVDFCKTHGLM